MSKLELIAIHIPKTAGSAFTSVMSRAYGHSAVQLYGRDTPRTDGEIPNEWLRPQTRVLVGHFTFQQVARLHRQHQCHLVTFVRDPVERFLANFYHFKSGKEHFDRWHRLRRYEPLYLHVLIARYRNVMARYLRGSDINQYLCVGLAERFQEDVQYIGRTLHWPEQADANAGVFGERRRINVNEVWPLQSRSLSTASRWLLRRANRQDIELYDRVLSFRNATRPDDVALDHGPIS